MSGSSFSAVCSLHEEFPSLSLFFLWAIAYSLSVLSALSDFVYVKGCPSRAVVSTLVSH